MPSATEPQVEKPQGLIDVHHHFIPECYAQALHASGGDPSGWKLPNWSVEASKSLMNTHNIQTSILSLTAPGCTILSGSAASSLARAVNESAASIRDSEPESFGFFASLPPVLDDTAAAISEIEYALDELKADGVTLYTRYGEGNFYLGHSDYQPVWEVLNKRKAVVFIHPTHLVDTNLVNKKLPQPIIDYPHETTRTAVDMIMAGVMRAYPDVKIILSHAGGNLPFLATRAAHLLADAGLLAEGMTAEDFLEDVRKFYFDTALSGNDFSLPLLMEFAPEGHVLFGSDFPYAPLKTVDTHTRAGNKVLKARKGAKNSEWDNAAKALIERLR